MEKAASEAGLEPAFVFVGDPWRDADTWSVIAERAPHARAVAVDEDERRVDARDWVTPGRWERMVELRNALLQAVRRTSPDWFWSLDSDILAHPRALALSIEALETRHWDAVGQRCYMKAKSTLCPSYGMRRGGTFSHGVDSTGWFEVDVIMAAKLMTPAAYAVDYRYEHFGEDLGWSAAAKEAGLTLGWDGRVGSKHVMGHCLDDPRRAECAECRARELVDIDERIGW